jgi:hypothetical protein
MKCETPVLIPTDLYLSQILVQLWTSYFKLPWIVSGSSDEALAGTIGGLAGDLTSDLERNFSISATTLKAAFNANKTFVVGLENATWVHTTAKTLLPQLPPNRQQFFKSHLLVQSAIQRFSVEAIAALINVTSILASTPVPGSAEVQVAQVRVQLALDAFDALFQAQRDAEGTEEWRGMYWADRHRFTNYQARRRQILRLRASLQKSPFNPDTQIDCCQMEYSYQWTPAHLASYPLIYDQPDQRARDFVLVSCVNATADGGLCQSNRTGGFFSKSATVTLALVQALQETGDTIQYSLGGEEPMLPYKTPLIITQTTTIRAVKVSANGDTIHLARNVTYVRR